MQLAAIPTATPASPVASAAAPGGAPTFQGGIDFEGSGRFTRFSAHATTHVYGAVEGYATLQEAIDATTLATIGSRQTAAGVFELDGRFHSRRLDNVLTFKNGAEWSGAWRLEQYPADLELLDGHVSGTIRRVEALRAVVDGAQRHDVAHLKVAPPTPR